MENEKKIYQMPANQQMAMFQAIVSQDQYFWSKVTAGFVMGFIVGAAVGAMFL